MKYSSFSFIFITLFSNAIHAEALPTAFDAEQFCETEKYNSYLILEKLDVKDSKTVSEDCNSQALYYGFHPVDKPDYKKARLCAIKRLNAPDDVSIEKEVEAATLMMIHANGFSTPRNMDFALHYACMASGSPAEMDGRIQNLLDMKSNESKKQQIKLFDTCDNLTSGYMQSQCEHINEQIEEVQRVKSFKKFVDSFSDPKIKMVATNIRKLHTEYAELQVEAETDMSGSAGDAFYFSNFIKEKNQFMTFIKDINSHLNSGSQKTIKDADVELNIIYKKVITEIKKNNYQSPGTVSVSKVIKSERAFLKYKDMTLEKFKILYPTNNLYGIETYLLKNRVDELKYLFESIKE